MRGRHNAAILLQTRAALSAGPRRRLTRRPDGHFCGTRSLGLVVSRRVGAFRARRWTGYAAVARGRSSSSSPRFRTCRQQPACAQATSSVSLRRSKAPSAGDFGCFRKLPRLHADARMMRWVRGGGDKFFLGGDGARASMVTAHPTGFGINLGRELGKSPASTLKFYLCSCFLRITP